MPYPAQNSWEAQILQLLSQPLKDFLCALAGIAAIRSRLIDDYATSLMNSKVAEGWGERQALMQRLEDELDQCVGAALESLLRAVWCRGQALDKRFNFISLLELIKKFFPKKSNLLFQHMLSEDSVLTFELALQVNDQALEKFFCRQENYQERLQHRKNRQAEIFIANGLYQLIIMMESRDLSFPHPLLHRITVKYKDRLQFDLAQFKQILSYEDYLKRYQQLVESVGANYNTLLGLFIAEPALFFQCQKKFSRQFRAYANFFTECNITFFTLVIAMQSYQKFKRSLSQRRQLYQLFQSSRTQLQPLLQQIYRYYVAHSSQVPPVWKRAFNLFAIYYVGLIGPAQNQSSLRQVPTLFSYCVGACMDQGLIQSFEQLDLPHLELIRSLSSARAQF